MPYRENPKTAGSGILCAIPQTGACPNRCRDCFFQSGRSHLEPLSENLPNLPPPEMAENRVVRVNDGNDSNVDIETVLRETGAGRYPMRFYNTAIPKNLDRFDAPVVLTVNPGPLTDRDFHRTWAENLMFVRIRTNTWNLPLVEAAVSYYARHKVVSVLTFMAYYETASAIPEGHRSNYVLRKRTLNRYHAITTAAWRRVMRRWEDTPEERWVYSCGKIEGEGGTAACRHCGNCLREYFAAMEKMRAPGAAGGV